MKLSNPLKLIISVVMCLLAGIIGSVFTSSAIPTWYATLNKPSFNPPSWLFGPVWTLLYILMGISFYLIWKEYTKKSNKKIKEFQKTAIKIFIIQLILNALWSIIFFGLHWIFIAFIEIILMWIFILLSIIKFHKISKTASYLLIPYILWVSFASILNLAILILN